MIDFMLYFIESMLCNAIRSFSGFRGDRVEFFSFVVGGSEGGGGDSREVEVKRWV